MHNSDLVQILDCIEKLLKKLAGLKLGQFLIFDYMFEQFSSAGVLSHNVVMAAILQYLEELYEIGMSCFSQYFQLLIESESITFILNFTLAYYFDCNHLVC